MEKFERHHLEFNLTYPYIVEHLESGKTLSDAVLKNCDFKLGSFHTILPKNANLNGIYLFEEGGIIPQEKEKNLIDFHGSKVWYQEITSAREEMIQYVYKFLKKNCEGTVVLEDVLRKKGNKFTNIKNVFLSYFNNEVYYILKPRNTYEEISDSIKQTIEVWHFLAILIPHHIELTEELSEAQIKLLSSSIQKLIIVAYDRESYIFWERN